MLHCPCMASSHIIANELTIDIIMLGTAWSIKINILLKCMYASYANVSVRICLLLLTSCTAIREYLSTIISLLQIDFQNVFGEPGMYLVTFIWVKLVISFKQNKNNK